MSVSHYDHPKNGKYGTLQTVSGKVSPSLRDFLKQKAKERKTSITKLVALIVFNWAISQGYERS